MLKGIEKHILFMLGEILLPTAVNGISIVNSSSVGEASTKPESSNNQVLYSLVIDGVRIMDLRVWLLAIIEDSSAPFRTVCLGL